MKMKRSTIIALCLALISVSTFAYGGAVGCCLHHSISPAYANLHETRCSKTPAPGRRPDLKSTGECVHCSCLTPEHMAALTLGASPGKAFGDRGGRNDVGEEIAVQNRFAGTTRHSGRFSLFTFDGKDRVLRECAFLS